MQGAWSADATTGPPRGPYGHTCAGEYKTIGCLGDGPGNGYMSPHA